MLLEHLFLFFCCSFGAWGGFPKIPPTKGKPWPLPQNELQGEGYMTIDPLNFQFSSKNGFSCPMLEKAFKRYVSIMFPKNHRQMHVKSKNNSKTCNLKSLTALDVKLNLECEDIPHLNMDELYELRICPPNNRNKATLTSQTIWGALRGLETFSQIIVPVGQSLYHINCTQIMDFPRYSHRGVMLDTSRHFLPLQIIQENLDLMAMNKFNVFHWHIVDDQSFPYQSERYPDLSKKGSWSDMHVYSKKDIETVVEYARNLGIRVIAEFDTPGHTLSWGEGQPGLLTPCYNANRTMDGTFGPIDPTKEENYEFIRSLFEEVTGWFPEPYLHLGGDEVPFECWKSNPNIKDFMMSHNIKTYPELEQYYITRLINITSNLPAKNRYIVWQEVFDNGVNVAADTVVHVWKNENSPSLWAQELQKVTSAGFKAILSSCWYLNYISYGVDWTKFYDCDPEGFNGTMAQKNKILGGEACMWGEYIDKTNVISRTWPRASAVAERLWSNAESTEDADEAAPRLEEHRCRLLSRGFAVEPLGPSYCEGIL